MVSIGFFPPGFFLYLEGLYPMDDFDMALEGLYPMDDFDMALLLSRVMLTQDAE
jgi:hypothetical protein